MAKYHVGCGIIGIYAGTLNKKGDTWTRKSDVWHQDRMDGLGVTDILDPKQNIRTGVGFLLELFEKILRRNGY
jgi:hypothetical protein